jgi:menaquinone-dependent protoporphyrinogen oxidase
VAYATRYGSTREAAEAIAASLREEGVEAVVQPARKVTGANGWSAIVLGAPIYFGAWHKDALRHLERNKEELLRTPTAVFALGPTHLADRGASHDQLHAVLAGYPWLKPIASEVFGGKYDPGRLNLAHRLVSILPASPLHGAPASDARDWTAIATWAKELAGRIR